uniref:AP-4 complex subunit beta-1 n=1 Tax=Petromyzon marinus TaxID=7757 RepID=A0AAJ7WUE9_PETMA|nr:AP-4 complex subunit beta-1 [Petromyzon marinus]
MPHLPGEDDLALELKRTLSNPAVQGDPARYMAALRRVVAQTARGRDMSSVFMEVLRASTAADLPHKKLAYQYLCEYAARKPDMALLAVNSLRKDCADPSPMVRGMALRSLCGLRLPDLGEYVQGPVASGLRDRAAYVRRTAVLGCAKLHRLQQPDADIDATLVNELYGLLRDKDPVVMVNCLHALEEILQREGGVVINRPIAHHLVNRLPECDEWGQAAVLSFLLRYQPRSEGETLDVLNRLDGLLEPARSPGVSLAAGKLFIAYTGGLGEAVRRDVLARVGAPLLSACGDQSIEMRYAALCHVRELLGCNPGMFSGHYKRFFCRHEDPAYVKHVKVELLSHLANDHTVAEILEELRGYCTDVCANLAQATILAIGQIGRTYSEQCLKILIALVGLSQEHITSAVLQALRELVWHWPSCAPSVCRVLPGCEEIVTDSEGKRALVWLLGQLGSEVPEAPYILEEYIDGLSVETVALVRMELLVATVRLFLSRPAECQDMLGRLLQYCIEEDTNMVVRDRALIYYRLLQSGPEWTRHVVLGPGGASGDDGGAACALPQEPPSLPLSAVLPRFNTLAPLLTPPPPAALLIRLEDEDEDTSETRPRTHPDLSGLSLEGPSGATPLSLVTSPLSPAQFEALWLKWETAQTFTVVWGTSSASTAQPPDAADTGGVAVNGRLPVSEDAGATGSRVDSVAVEAGLRAVGVQVMAVSGAGLAPWKAFVFAHDADGTLFLAEMAQAERATLDVAVKQGPPDARLLADFVTLLRATLQVLGEGDVALTTPEPADDGGQCE